MDIRPQMSSRVSGKRPSPTSTDLRVLIVTYFFPPMGGGGVQRTLKFTKYLPDFGFTPTVICAESDLYPRDDGLADQIPAGTEVIRFEHTPLPARLLALRQRWRRSSTDQSAPDSSATAARQATGSAVWRDRLLMAWAAVQVPDDSASWSRRAGRAASEILSQRPVDIVVSSSPPVSAHFAAMRAAHRAGVPWVADFRDLWTGNPAYMAPRWRRNLDRRMERRLLAAADGVITVSTPLESELATMTRPGVATITIPNGYDEDDFSGITPSPSEDGVFRIVHAGTFYGHRSPESFIHGVQHWLDENEEGRNRLRVRFIGAVGSRFDPVLAAFARRYPGVLEWRGYVEHAEALTEVVSADALLLVVGGGKAADGIMTGKIFEYLRAGRPILFMGPSGSEAARLIRESGAGEIVDEQRGGNLGEILDRWVLRGGAPTPDKAQAARFERKLLTREFAEFLTSVRARYRPRVS